MQGGRSSIGDHTSTCFEHLLSEAEVANFLGVAIHTLRCWRSAGKGPPYAKLGRKVKYISPLLGSWISRQIRNVGGTDERCELPAGTPDQRRELALSREASGPRVGRKHRLGGYETKRKRRLERSGHGPGGGAERTNGPALTGGPKV